MKGPLDRTKVLLRHLPPSISQSTLIAQIDSVFSGRYNLVSFHPGKNSPKRNYYSRAYIDFRNPDYVMEFAQFFDGHVFVNEKGTQFKTMVEYSPSQRVPKQCSKKDAREGTILKDPEYMEFLDLISKPIEYLPSAEIQLERKDAERAGASVDNSIVTPLMDFVRKKRAAKSQSRRSQCAGKLSRKLSGEQSGASSSKRGADKKKLSSTMYVLRDSGKVSVGKGKQHGHMVVGKGDNQQRRSDSVDEKGGGNKKILLLKGKRDQQHSAAHESSSAAVKQNQRREGKIIKSILLKDTQRHFEMQQLQPPISLLLSSSNLHVTNGEDKGRIGGCEQLVGNNKPDNNHLMKQSVRTKDSSVWAPLWKDKSQKQLHRPPSSEAILPNVMGTRGVASSSSTENGSHNKSASPRGNLKDSADCSTPAEVVLKSSRRAPSFHNDKQVWVQKPSAT